MRKLLLLSCVLCFCSCNNIDVEKLILINETDAINIDKSGISEPNVNALIKIFPLKGYKLIEAYYKCDVESGITLDVSKTKILECGEKINRNSDTVLMYFTPGISDVYIESITLLMQNPNGQFGICKTTISHKW